MADLGAFLSELRAHGVTRISIDLSPEVTHRGDGGQVVDLGSLLSQAGPAPAPPEEGKPDNECAEPGCGRPNGHPFAPELCREHALTAAGVG